MHSPWGGPEWAGCARSLLAGQAPLHIAQYARSLHSNADYLLAIWLSTLQCLDMDSIFLPSTLHSAASGEGKGLGSAAACAVVTAVAGMKQPMP